MTFLVGTQRTNATVSAGLPSNTIIGGAASMSDAVGDNSATTGIRLAARARLEAQLVRLAVQPPVLDGTDRVYSIGVRIQLRSVLDSVDPEDRPLLLGWLRTQSGTVAVAGAQPAPVRTAFERRAPTDPIATTVQEINLGEFTSAPGGEPWTAANMATLALELGRGDDSAEHLDVIAVFFDVYYQQIATVEMTGPPDPNPDTAATLTWDYDQSSFAPQSEWRGAVHPLASTLADGFDPWATPTPYISGQAGSDPDSSWWESGEVQQWTIPEDLPADGEYVGYIQAAAQWPGAGGRFVTAVESTSWTRDASAADPPPAPELTSVDYSREQMRNLILITPGAGGTTDAYTVLRCTDGDNFFPASPSLTRIPADGDNPIEVFDRFMPLNTPARYKVVAYAGDPLVAGLEMSGEITVTPRDDRVILRHPTNDLLDTAIVIKGPKAAEGIERTWHQMQGTAQFSGGPGTKVPMMMMWGPDYGWSYDLTMLFVEADDPTLRDRVELLDASHSPLFLQWPMRGEQLWGGLGPGVSGNPTREKFNVVAGNIAAYQWINRMSTFTECAAPETY